MSHVNHRRPKDSRPSHRIVAGRADHEVFRASLGAGREESETPLWLELEESRERYADLFDFAPVGYLTLDFSGCVRDMNLVSAHVLGVRRRFWMGRPLLPLVARDDRVKFLEHLGRLRRGQSPVTTELSFLPRQGPLVVLQLVSISKCPGPGSRVEFRTALLDITERRRAEDALHQNTQMLEALVRASPLAVVVVGRNLRVQLWNPAAERLFGWEASAVLGHHLPIVPRHQRQRYLSLLDIELEGRCLIGEEVIRQRKDGSLVEVSVSSAPLRDSQGMLTAFVRIYEDITERKRTEQALRQVHETLEQRVAERTAELGQINDRLRREITERVRLEGEVVQISELERQRIGQDLHDGVCQLLTGIRLKSQLLQEDLGDAGPSLRRRVARITALLSQAQEQARAAAHGLQPVEDIPEGLTRALYNLADLTRDLFAIECSCHIRRPILVENHDVATDLLRVAQEAVSNAVKHGKARNVELRLSRDAGQLVLEIINDGKSFPNRPLSSGVGLKTMNYRTQRIGATLHIGPEPGAGPSRGTIVRCTLPLSKALSNGEPPPEPARATNRGFSRHSTA
jgi:PAS domain S-box-containing protein